MGPLERDTAMPHGGGLDKAGSCDVYDLRSQKALSEFAGQAMRRLQSREMV
jgi:hypothetical protein